MGHSGSTNVVCNIRCLSPDDIVWDNKPSGYFWKRMVETVQSSIEMIMDFDAQNFEAGTAGSGSFHWDSVNFPGCLQAENHHHVFGWEKNVWCLDKGMPSVVEAYASQVSSQVLDFPGDEDPMEAARVFKMAMKGRVRGVLEDWGLHLDLPISTRSRSKWCSTFAVYRRTNLRILKRDACRTGWGLKWEKSEWVKSVNEMLA